MDAGKRADRNPPLRPLKKQNGPRSIREVSRRGDIFAFGCVKSLHRAVHQPVRNPAVSRVSAKPPVDPPHKEIPDRVIVGRMGGQAARLWRPVRFGGPIAIRVRMPGCGPRFAALKKSPIRKKNY